MTQGWTWLRVSGAGRLLISSSSSDGGHPARSSGGVYDGVLCDGGKGANQWLRTEPVALTTVCCEVGQASGCVCVYWNSLRQMRSGSLPLCRVEGLPTPQDVGIKRVFVVIVVMRCVCVWMICL